MLYEFIVTHRSQLLERCKQLRTARSLPSVDERTDEGIALFLDQLGESLRVGLSNDQQPTGPAVADGDAGMPSPFDIGSAAAVQGRAMQELGFTVTDVVHSYGDISHAIVELALQRDLSFAVSEYRMLNRCLDNAIASAVTEFSYQHDSGNAMQREQQESQRLALLGNELRNQLGTASLAVSALKARELPLGGTTGTILERSLLSLGRLVDDMLLAAQRQHASDDLLDLLPLADFMEKLRATIEPTGAAQARRLTLSAVDPRLGVRGNRDVLEAVALGLLQAAFQVTGAGNAVAMHAYASGARIRIDIVCPGVPTLPPAQHLALAVADRMVTGMNGVLTIHHGNDVPLTLSISLPRWTLPS